jgi:prepilin-type N-terminal cleavage/methylation domain-containing protein
MKKGFTLIELMVVIVIIGILAAIAVPKMFGMSAKAKAAEVTPAKGTWKKLQAAYHMETSRNGHWTSIGYTAPNGTGGNPSATTNFTYSELRHPTGALSTNTRGVWAANPLLILNECPVATTWSASIEGADVGGTLIGAASNAAACQALTPLFAQ